MNLSKTKINFVNQNKKLHGGGWPGDVPKIVLDNKKMQKLGWIPHFDSKKSIIMTINDILNDKHY